MQMRIYMVSVRRHLLPLQILERREEEEEEEEEEAAGAEQGSAMVAGVNGGGSRMLGAAATVRAFHPDSHPPPSPSCSPSAASGAGARRIPSLSFPVMSEPKKQQYGGHGVSLAAEHEQRAGLVSLGAAGAGAAPEKRRGLFAPPRPPPEEEAKSVDLLLPLAYEITRRLLLRQFGATWLALTRKCWAKIAETVIHQGVVRCQSFTLIGVAGSLVGSVPCFLEGCGVVLKSFFMQFRAMWPMSQMVDQAEIIKLLIEAIDMFLIGTALLTFGMGMFIMFYGSRSIQKQIDRSHLGEFNLKKLKEGARMQCLTQAKSRIGHAVLLLLQAGVLEKFKSVPLANGLDMACFAGAVLASSAGVFLLSRLAVRRQQKTQTRKQSSCVAA